MSKFVDFKAKLLRQGRYLSVKGSFFKEDQADPRSPVERVEVSAEDVGFSEVRDMLYVNVLINPEPHENATAIQFSYAAKFRQEKRRHYKQIEIRLINSQTNMVIANVRIQ